MTAAVGLIITKVLKNRPTLSIRCK